MEYLTPSIEHRPSLPITVFWHGSTFLAAPPGEVTDIGPAPAFLGPHALQGKFLYRDVKRCPCQAQ
eukprot:6497022-Pyramimonas_sp.AAC.1